MLEIWRDWCRVLPLQASGRPLDDQLYYSRASSAPSAGAICSPRTQTASLLSLRESGAQGFEATNWPRTTTAPPVTPRRRSTRPLAIPGRRSASRLGFAGSTPMGRVSTESRVGQAAAMEALRTSSEAPVSTFDELPQSSFRCQSPDARSQPTSPTPTAATISRSLTQATRAGVHLRRAKGAVAGGTAVLRALASQATREFAQRALPTMVDEGPRTTRASGAASHACLSVSKYRSETSDREPRSLSLPAGSRRSITRHVWSVLHRTRSELPDDVRFPLW